MNPNNCFNHIANISILFLGLLYNPIIYFMIPHWIFVLCDESTCTKNQIFIHVTSHQCCMVVFGQDEIAKYPFLADAGQYLKEQGFTLEQFGKDPDLRHIVDRALQRIEVAANGGIYKSDLHKGKVSSDMMLLVEIFSFLLAIVLLRLSGAHTLIKRFALAEARRAEKYLERDLANRFDPIKKEVALRLIRDLFSVNAEIHDDFFVVPVSDYLKRAAYFYEREWKIVNRRIEAGRVLLDTHEMARLIRKELSTYINSKILSAKAPAMLAGFEEHVTRLVSLAGRFEDSSRHGKTASGEGISYPPCIKHAVDLLEDGENLPHSARFMLGTFLLTKGLPIEQIAPLFKNAPDYNESITMYQLNHLAGISSGGKRYLCPSCSKIRTQGLCFATSECDGIINPLQFSGSKSGTKPDQTEQETDSNGADGQ